MLLSAAESESLMSNKIPDLQILTSFRARPYEQGKLSGKLQLQEQEISIGSGSLFHIGDKVEKAVFRYTTESVEFEIGSDYGSITNNPA